MSGSRTNLEQILELLLAEETEKAEQMLHEYVVAKARSEYEKVLDESEEEEFEEAIDKTNDFEDDIMDDEDEIEDDELGESEDEEMGDEMDMDMDMEEPEAEDEFGGEEEEGEEEEGEDDDLEDKVEDLEAELEDLRAEFEKLMNDEMGDSEEDDMFGGDEEGDEGEEEMMDSYEYDLDEAEEVDEEEELEEATQFSQKTAEQPMKSAHTLKGGEDDSANSKSPYTNAPKPTHVKNGNTGPVKSKDGSEGKKNHGGSVKDHTPTDNMKVEPGKAKRPADGNYQ